MILINIMTKDNTQYTSTTIINASKQNIITPKRNFLRSAPSRPNNIYVFSPLFWVSIEGYIFDIPETGIRHVIVMTHFEIPIGKGTATVYTLCGGLVLIGYHRPHGYLMRYNFTYHTAFLHNVIIKLGHGIWAAVQFWRSAVLRFRWYAVTAEAADAVYVELLHTVTLLLLLLPF